MIRIKNAARSSMRVQSLRLIQIKALRESRPMPFRNPGDQFLADYLRHGMTPFFGLPLADSSKPGAFEGCRVVFLGVPHDASVSQHPGARFGPYAVRKASIFAVDASVLQLLGGKAVDGGNVPSPFGSPEGMRTAVEQGVREVLDCGAVPFLVGGDHSIALPSMRAVAKKHGPLAVIHVDAHPDLSPPSELLSADAYHHGAPLKHALEEGLIAKGQLHQLGIRIPHDEGYALTHGVRVHGIDELADRGVAAVMAEVRSAIGDRPVYLTFDIDAVDPAFAPGTGTPVAGGLSSREALRLVRSMAGLRLVGLDLVEVLPALDHADLTSLLAAQLLSEALGVLGASV